MSEMVTVPKSSPDFQKYLRGTFSRDHRALPVQSLNVNTQTEAVTFRIVAKKDIQSPPLVLIFLKALRVRRFLFVLFPLFFVLLHNYQAHQIRDVWVLLASTLGLIFLYAAVQLRNDFHDHLNGLDRLASENTSSVSQAIQKGWISAEDAKSMSWIFTFFSFLCSWPVLLVFPQVLWVMACAGVLLFWSLFRGQNSFKNVAAGELVFGILVGPLLSLGYEFSITGQSTLLVFFFGCVWGWLVLFRLHLQNFESLLTYSQAGLKNLINFLGFDRAKRFLLGWWLTFIFIFSLFHGLTSSPWVWMGSVLILLGLSLRFYRRLSSLTSPVGSEMRFLQMEGQLLFNSVVLLWTTEILFVFLIEEFFGALVRGI